MPIRALLAVWTAISLAACGYDEGRDDASYDAVAVPGTRCQAVVQRRHGEGSAHVAECSTVSYRSNPPSSGNHYQNWSGFGIYEQPLPRGYWVHALEHGAIVVSYDCAECDADLAAARAFFDALPPDAVCVVHGSARPRAMLTPDPLLDVPWAASAWGWTLRANCFEPEVFSDFYTEHLGRGPEQVCSPGSDLRDAGALVLPAACEVDAGADD